MSTLLISFKNEKILEHHLIGSKACSDLARSVVRQSELH